MAILFAYAHPKLEVLGLTTIFGNVATELATANALRLVEVVGADTPVCEGEKSALAGPPRPYPDWVHGKDGFGDIGWPAPSGTVDPRHAVDFIAESIRDHPNEVTLVPVGPLTNIARLVQRHPDVIELVKEVVVMGGSAFRQGNVTPLAEANTANDPEGADLVFGASWPLVMVGLDVTSNTTVTTADFAQITSSNEQFGPFLSQAAAYYIRFYSDTLGVDGCCMHDVAAVALPIAREIFTLTAARLRVETKGFSRGKTAAMPASFVSDDAQWLERPLHKYASGIDAAAMRDLFVNTLMTAPPGSGTSLQS